MEFQLYSIDLCVMDRAHHLMDGHALSARWRQHLFLRCNASSVPMLAILLVCITLTCFLITWNLTNRILQTLRAIRTLIGYQERNNLL